MEGIAILDELFTGVQSALAPRGPNAEGIATLSWIMFAGAGLIFLLVMALLAFALLAPPGRRGWLADRRMVIAGGIVFPVVVLSALLVYGLALARGLVSVPGEAPLEIHVVGEQFWWRVRYEADDGREPLVTANEIHIPVGRPVRFTLTTADVIHSFWVPSLAGKLDMIPGQANRLVLKADRPGVYRGQCAEFCGAAHALMAFEVVAHAPEAFEDWLRAERQPARAPPTTFQARGRDLFIQSGCGACHRVRGTSADGDLGPDLTHIGSRRSIAAGIYPNNRGTLAGWIASSQHLKPNNKMPSFPVFSGEDLRAIAAYLEGLK
ncbi:cytochrome c oxidase subunit II [Chelatococcus sp. GCM10030263]|uniref:cytochrome c oxidase subunit II n=1 Tax=Chelatococcus sp. GCM10030263 TaxID=3273387 RepID=UPI0036071052